MAVPGSRIPDLRIEPPVMVYVIRTEDSTGMEQVYGVFDDREAARQKGQELVDAIIACIQKEHPDWRPMEREMSNWLRDWCDADLSRDLRIVVEGYTLNECFMPTGWYGQAP